MKPFFDDADEVEHVIGLTKNPGYRVTLAGMLREHAIAAGVPAHWLDGLLASPYEPGCDAAGMPLDLAHPWNGGPGYGVSLNSRQWAIVEALEAAEQDRDISALLWSLRAIESEPAAAHGEKFPGRKPGAVSPITKAVDAALEKNPKAKASAIEVWQAVQKNPPKGYRLMDGYSDKYIECGIKHVMGWPRFQTLVSERRKERRKKLSK